MLGKCLITECSNGQNMKIPAFVGRDHSMINKLIV